MVTEGGMHIFTLVDSGLAIVIPFVCLCEVVAIAYFYGGMRYARDLRYMLNINIPVMCFPVCWYAVTPFVCTVFGFYLLQSSSSIVDQYSIIG